MVLIDFTAHVYAMKIVDSYYFDFKGLLKFLTLLIIYSNSYIATGQHLLI